LRGRFYLARRGPWVLKAIGHFEKAISIDARFALAYAGLADAELVSSFYSIRPGIEVMQKGKEAADKCIEIEPLAPEPYSSLGYYYVALVRDAEKGREFFMKSLELNPNYTLGRYMLALLYYAWTKGDMEKALEHSLLSIRQEPLSAIVHSVHSLVLATAGRVEEVAEFAKTAIDLDMNAFLAHRSLVIATRNLKLYDEALEYANRFVAISNRHSQSVFDLLEVHAAMGNDKEVEKLYNELITRSKKEYINSTCMALAAADYGDIDQAFLYFQKAAEERDVMLLTLPHIAYHATSFLKHDPRFKELVSLHEPEKALLEVN
jgi:tetratricopeptide (TPR) repeat protein